MIIEIFLGIIMFTGLVLALTVIILIIKSTVMPTGDVTIDINTERKIIVPIGEKLLSVLAVSDIFLPSACGGKGTCGQCKVAVLEGGGSILPTETSLLSKHEANNYMRLACQVIIKHDMRLRLPSEIFGVKKWECKVRSSRNMSTFIREIIFELPSDESMNFHAGGYVQVECPEYHVHFKDFEIEDKYENEWDRFNLWRYEAEAKKPTTRAYSMANYPDEKNIIMLNVRIAIPPPGSEPTTPPGVVSSYLFSLKPNDKVIISGPYGDFYAKETNNEMIFIGGGAGMAPMRSHILDQLLRIKTKRKISFWYGARSRQELFYQDLFDPLQTKYENFNWHIALSDPKQEDQWDGSTGFIHQVLYDTYLQNHPSPEDCEYYLCGPPMMNISVFKMLEDLGVDKENIMLDEFGG